MPTKYTTQKVNSDHEIYRNDVHVATYDPATDDTTYTNGNDKYAGPIGRQVIQLKETPPEGELYEAEVIILEEPDPQRESKSGEVKLILQLANQAKHITSLKQEIFDLKRLLRGDKKPKTPARYEGIDYAPEGSPCKGPHGDLTPEFVEWARNGGWSEAHFLQVYTGRLKDLTYKG